MKWVLFVIIFVFFSALIGAVCEMSIPFDNEEMSVLEELMALDAPTFNNVPEAITTTVVFSGDLILLLFKMGTMQYSFLTGSWVIIRYIYMAVGLMVVVYFGITMVNRGSVS